MKFEGPQKIRANVNKILRDRQNFLDENDIHQTIPKETVREINRDQALISDLEREIKYSTKQIFEKYKEYRLEKRSPRFSQKISPEEYLNLSETIRHAKLLSHPERAQKIKDIKETIMWFRFELGQAEKRIVKSISEHPPKSLATLEHLCRSELSSLPIGPDMQEKIDLICRRYFARNKKMQELRDQFPNDKDLFKELIGHDPIGPVEIINSPVGFYIRAHDLEDFTRVGNIWMTREFASKDERKEIMQDANKAGGYKLNGALHKELKGGGIMTENSKGRLFTGYSKEVYRHEVQHALHDFFNDSFHDSTAEWNFSTSVVASAPEKCKNALAQVYLEKRRKKIDPRAKDEILAYTTDQGRSSKSIKETLLDKEGLYDYFEKSDKDSLTKIPHVYIQFSDERIKKDILIQNLLKNDSGNNRVYELLEPYEEAENRHIKKILEPVKDVIIKKIFEKDYTKTVSDGIECVTKLQKAGLDTALIVRILTHEPLHSWKKLTARLLEDYKNPV